MEDSISREARGGSPLASCCPHATVFNSIQQPIRVRSLFTNPIEKKEDFFVGDGYNSTTWRAA
jgi:hypothetical protein